MNSFDYHAPTSLAETFELMATHGPDAHLMAGGTALAPTEVLVAVELPPLAAGTRVTYKKFLPRTQDDYATVSVAASLRLDADARCEDVSVSLGAAATTPVRARKVEAALRGQRVTPGAINEAAALVVDEVDPLDDLRGSAAYKREMARVWTQRALFELLDAYG